MWTPVLSNKDVGDVDNHLNNIKNSLIDVTKDQDLQSAKLIKALKVWIELQ